MRLLSLRKATSQIPAFVRLSADFFIESNQQNGAQFVDADIVSAQKKAVGTR